MKALGYEEGRNVQLDWRNLADETAAHGTATAFARDRGDVIVAFESLTVRAAMEATADIPIVFINAADPVENGFAKSLAHPGGNVTGFAGATGLSAKMIETPALLGEIQTAAKHLKITRVRRDASTGRDLERIFETLRRGELDGVLAVSPYLTRRFFE